MQSILYLFHSFIRGSGIFFYLSQFKRTAEKICTELKKVTFVYLEIRLCFCIPGNCIGEDGIEEVRSKLREFERGEALQSMSDDEGEEEDDDEESEDDDEDDNNDNEDLSEDNEEKGEVNDEKKTTDEV